MSERTTSASIKDFTPLLDGLVERYGLITAAVWGRMWRYAQGDAGTCGASLETLARELNISRMTVIRNIKLLEGCGYLIDTTPSLRNHPHIYTVVSRLDADGTVTQSDGTVTQSDGTVTQSDGTVTQSDGTVTQSDGTVTQSDGTVTQSDSHSNTELLEETMKKQFKKDSGLSAKNALNPDNGAGDLTETQKRVLALFGGKRFKTPAQRAKVLALEQCHGVEKLVEYAEWAAQKGMTLGDAVAAGDKTLAKWGRNGNTAGVIRVQPGRERDGRR